MTSLQESTAPGSVINTGEEGPSLRSWLETLENAGQLHRISAQVDWDQEISAIARVNISQGGPGLLFENIKDHQDTLCTKFLTCSLSNRRQVNLMLGLPVDTSSKDITAHLRKVYRKPVQPTLVETGPVKENMITGDDIDVRQIPAPLWHHLDGGKYINTFAGVITKEPDSGLPNIGIYRGMILDKNKIGKLVIKTQGWGHHFIKRGMKPEPMPVAVVYGWHDVLPFCGASCFTKSVCEWDMMGAILGRPVELVKCETVDIEIPASAELVIEGYIDPDPKTFEMEGPFAEYPGYSGGVPSPKPVLKVSCITHRNDPIVRGALEGARPGFPSEDLATFIHSWPAIICNYLEDIGISGVTDAWLPPVASGTHIIVQIHKNYRGHAQQVATALWSWGIAQVSGKHIIVVEEDIDIRDPEAVEWAIAYRVNAGAGDIMTYGPTPGSPLDPSTPPHENNPGKYGAGKWTRVLFDATRSWAIEPSERFGGRRYPPVTKLPVELEKQIHRRWDEYGIKVPYLNEEDRQWLTMENISKILPEV